MTKFLNNCERFFELVLNTTKVLAGILLTIQMLIVCLEVVLRYFFNSPTVWVVEISSYIVLWVPLLSAAWVLRHDGHIRMDMLINNVNPKFRSILVGTTYITSAAICLIITWFGVKIVIELFQTNYLTQSVLMLPKWPIMAIIQLRFFLLFIEFLIIFIKLPATKNALPK